VLAKVEKHQKEGQKVENYGFDLKKLEPFRYRFADALRAVTRIAIREARIKELRMELVKSQKLSRYVRAFFFPSPLQPLLTSQCSSKNTPNPSPTSVTIRISTTPPRSRPT
jgi:hypothetical protein